MTLFRDHLEGRAWGENAGWTDFGPGHGGVTIDPSTGSFKGYAWAENAGWIHFKNTHSAYNVVTAECRAHLPLVMRDSH